MRNDLNFLTEEINRLKKEKNAVILVHNYQRSEIYGVADFIGDSLELSHKAATTNASTIIFCGVRFMAETAKILNPEKTVLIPRQEAVCSLADMATVDEVLRIKKKYPDAAVVGYVNTNADVKALCDVCCTSANAVNVVNSLPQKQIIFLPDKNLGKYVQSKSDKEIILWDGYCAVHHLLDAESLVDFRNEHEGSKIIAHPECRTDILEIADHVCSTGGMAKYAQQSNSSEFIVVTECGMVNKLREDVPGKIFFSFCNFCPYMKIITLQSVYDALLKNQFEVDVPVKIQTEAKKAIDKMLELV